MRLWRSQVAHCSDKAGVPGSNPGSLIIKMEKQTERPEENYEGAIVPAPYASSKISSSVLETSLKRLKTFNADRVAYANNYLSLALD